MNTRGWLSMRRILRQTLLQWGGMMMLAAAATVVGWGAEGDWLTVQQLAEGTKVRVTVRENGKASLVAGVVGPKGDQSMVVRTGGGERALPKANVVRVQVANPEGRTKRGLLFLAIGGAAGAAAGVAACPHCSNEGTEGYWRQGLGIGLAAGALGFVGTPYRTVYSVK